MSSCYLNAIGYQESKSTPTLRNASTAQHGYFLGLSYSWAKKSLKKAGKRSSIMAVRADFISCSW